MYMPGAGPLFTISREKYVNTWNTRNAPTIPDDLSDPADALAVELFVRHISLLCGGWNREADLLASFMKSAIFNPGQKIRWAPLLIGRQGIGKSFIDTFFRHALGSEHVGVVNNEIVKNSSDSGKNGWAHGKQIGVMNEVKATGHSRHDIYNALKALITDDMISLRRLFKDVETVHNLTNWILFSNYRDCLPIDDKDRRFFVLYLVFPLAWQQTEDPHYFDKLFSATSTNIGGILRWLSDFEYHPDFDPNGHAPMTEHKQKMYGLSGSDLSDAVIETLKTSDSWAVKPDLLLAGHLRDMVAAPGTDGRGATSVTDGEVRSVLEKLGYLKIGAVHEHVGAAVIKGVLWAATDVSKKTATDLLLARFSACSQNNLNDGGF
jgi:hypothetical protein